MSCEPPYAYRPTTFVAGPTPTIAPQYVEKRARINAGKSGQPFFRSRNFGDTTNNIAYEISGTVNNNPSPGVFPPGHGGADDYTLYNLRVRVYYLDVVCLEHSWIQYRSETTTIGVDPEPNTTETTISNGLQYLKSIINNGNNWEDGSVLLEHLPSWDRTKADVVNMPVRGSSNTNDFYDNYQGEFGIEPAIDGDVIVNLTSKRYLVGGSGGPADASAVEFIRTGEQRTIAIIRETENDRGAPTLPRDAGRSPTIQWDGGSWVDYVPNSDCKI